MEPELPEALSPEVLGLLQKAQANAQIAQRILQFTINSVFEQYGLSPRDKIDLSNGTIERAVNEKDVQR
jgi:hypothetical protein